MKSRLVAFLIGILSTCSHLNAQTLTFTSSVEAVKYLDGICKKYWVASAMPNSVSQEIVVYEQGCRIFFYEKAITSKELSVDSPARNDVSNTLINLNLADIKITDNTTAIVLQGGAKDIVTLCYHGNYDINHKGEFSSVFKIPLLYDEQFVKESLPSISNAIKFLIGECANQATNKKPTLKK